VWRVAVGLSLAAIMAVFGVTSGRASGSPYAAKLAPGAQHANQRVIFILRNQHTELAGRANAAARTSAIVAEQAPVMSVLSSMNAANVSGFHVINAISATVTSASEA